jgi:hypothetical protein
MSTGNLSFSASLSVDTFNIAALCAAKSNFQAETNKGVKKNDCMAEDAVSCELLSTEFPANREKYRGYFGLNGAPSAISPKQKESWLEKHLRQAIRNRDRSGKELGHAIPCYGVLEYLIGPIFQ